MSFLSLAEFLFKSPEAFSAAKAAYAGHTDCWWFARRVPRKDLAEAIEQARNKYEAAGMLVPDALPAWKIGGEMVEVKGKR